MFNDSQTKLWRENLLTLKKDIKCLFIIAYYIFLNIEIYREKDIG